METLTHIAQAFLDLWMDAAVWLILGFIVAGLLRTFVSGDNFSRHLKGHGLWPAIKAALLGVPLPLCSCGVIPAALGLRRAGASKSATTAFLISTPETGVDSIAISYALLGPFMAIIRPIAALCSAIVAAGFVLLGEAKRTAASTAPQEPAQSGVTGGCCHHHEHKTSQPSLFNRIWQGQRYAFTELLEDISLWLLVGLFISACVVALVPNEALAELTQGPGAMIIMALVGVPMYICASASTPLAAGLLLAGVSPGAVLVFLLAGPASNISTLGIVHSEMGYRALIGYLLGVVLVAIGFGYLTNYLIDLWNINIQNELSSSNGLIPEFISWITAIGLAGLVAYDLYHKWHHRGKHHEHEHHDDEHGCCH